MSRNQTDCHQRHQIEQDYANLVNSKSGVMNGVKGFYRKLEPAAMHSVHPVMGQDKYGEPDE